MAIRQCEYHLDFLLEEESTSIIMKVATLFFAWLSCCMGEIAITKAESKCYHGSPGSVKVETIKDGYAYGSLLF